MAGSIANISKLWNPDFPDPSQSSIVFLDPVYIMFTILDFADHTRIQRLSLNGCTVLGSQVRFLTHSLGW